MWKFADIEQYMKNVSYTLITTEDEYNTGWKTIGRDTAIKFNCDKNHENSLFQKTYINYVNNIRNNKRRKLCVTCQREIKKEKSFEEKYDAIFKLTGHKLIRFEKGEELIFECGRCGKRARASYHKITHDKSCKNCESKDIPKINGDNSENNIINKDELICKCQNKNCEKFHIKQFPECYEKFLELIKKYEMVENMVINHMENIELLIEIEKELCKEDIEEKIKNIDTNFKCKCLNNNHTNECKINKYREICELRGFKILTTVKTYKNCKKLRVNCVCGEEKIKALSDIKRGRRCEKCSVQRRRAFNLVNHGCINTFQREEIKKKSVQKNMEKLGTEYPQQNKEVRAKTMETNKRRYGYSYAFNTPETFEKGRETMIKRYGSSYPFQSTEIQEKIEKSNVEIYGVERPLLTYRTKEYTLPSGKIVNIQGYENITLDSLLKENHFVLNRPVMESELILGNDIRKFPYTDINGKRRKYHPDISLQLKGDFIIEETSDGKLIPHHLDIYEYIEVKSFFTFNKSPKTNYEKWKAVVMTGNFLRVFIYTNTKKLWDVWWFYPNMNYPVRSQYNRVTVFDEPIELPRKVSQN